jgi:hypothetical protein
MTNRNIETIWPGVEITTRQLAKCEWNLDLASNFFNTRQLGGCFFSPLSESLCTNAQQRHDFVEFFSDLASKSLSYSPVWRVP